MYVIKRTDQSGGYVTPPGSHASYTQSLRQAWTFSTREDAYQQRCPDNEIVVSVESQLIPPSPIKTRI